ncbi:hypothetical protein HU200_018323 [Digitaria exilis]|uniref:aldehyde oxygenase (deformylating) n=1 Tax=Digitaria exilis TaxID=1010633 RepID=A0A835F5Q9_9POAL|nr:hypothetical protein HU200_018323 [Digitaria exilis]
MIPYTTAAEAEAALGRALTWPEAAWFRYSSATPDYCLHFHIVLILSVVYTLVPLPLVLLELRASAKLTSPAYKLQPRVRRRTPADFIRCYKDTVRALAPVTGALQLLSYPAVKMVGIRTGLPLPSVGETVAQLLVYFLIEDYLAYWVHRLLHTTWAYKKIHRVHHEYTAPNGFAAPYAHWAEVLILGVVAFASPAMVPCHMTTFGIQSIETHSG